MIIEKETYNNTKRKKKYQVIYIYILHYYLYLTAFVFFVFICFIVKLNYKIKQNDIPIMVKRKSTWTSAILVNPGVNHAFYLPFGNTASFWYLCCDIVRILLVLWYSYVNLRPVMDIKRMLLINQSRSAI